MKERRTALGLSLGLALAGIGCGHPESKVVDQYFRALNAQDSQTLSSFAVVSLDTKGKRVDKWTIIEASEESRQPSPLGDLIRKLKDAEAALAAHNKDWNAYKLEHYNELEKVRDLLKANGKIPAGLTAVAAEYEKVNQDDRELKKAVSEAKDAVEKEKRNESLSVGTSDGLEDLSGDMVTKQLDLALTIGSETQNYVMTLRKYDVSAAGQQGPRPMNRWVVFSLQPK